MRKFFYSESQFKHAMLHPRHQVLNHADLTLQNTSHQMLSRVTWFLPPFPHKQVLETTVLFSLSWVKLLFHPRKHLNTSL